MSPNPKQKWLVTLPLFASRYVEVEADTEEEAIEKAYNKGSRSLCNQCSRKFEMHDDDPSADPSAEKVE